MDIQGTMSSMSSSFCAAASSAGSAVKSFAETAVEKGRLGLNNTVTLVKENPRAAVATGVALLAVGLGVAVHTEAVSLNGINPFANSTEV